MIWLDGEGLRKFMSSDNLPLYLQPIPDHNPPNNTLYLVSLKKFLQSVGVASKDYTKEEYNVTTSCLYVNINVDEMIFDFSIDNEVVC